MQVITNYEKNKEDIDIAVFVSRSFSPLSLLIRGYLTLRFGKLSRWSHTGFIARETVEGEVRSVIYEADFKGGMVRKVPASIALQKLTYRIYPLRYANRGEIIAKLQKVWGRKYDTFGALFSTRRDTKTPETLFCSEMVGGILSEEYPFLFAYFSGIKRDGRGIIPDDIYEALELFNTNKQ